MITHHACPNLTKLSSAFLDFLTFWTISMLTGKVSMTWADRKRRSDCNIGKGEMGQ